MLHWGQTRVHIPEWFQFDESMVDSERNPAREEKLRLRRDESFILRDRVLGTKFLRVMVRN